MRLDSECITAGGGLQVCVIGILKVWLRWREPASCLHREAKKHPLRCPFQHKKHNENIQLCSPRLFLAKESLKEETQAHLYTACLNVCIFFLSAAKKVQHAKYLFISNNIYLIKTPPYRMYLRPSAAALWQGTAANCLTSIIDTVFNVSAMVTTAENQPKFGGGIFFFFFSLSACIPSSVAVRPQSVESDH